MTAQIDASNSNTTVAAIGECMVELSDAGRKTFALSFGGDTLNTAVYLARLGIPVDYVTALGDDNLSDAMVTEWHGEHVGTGKVLRMANRQPGLYMIERDAAGERTFRYWRREAPARDFFAVADEGLLASLARYDWLYLSGITLSLYDEASRERLFATLDAARCNGGRVVFDGNYRPRVWASPDVARHAFSLIMPRVDLAMPTFDDENLLFGDTDAHETAQRYIAAGAAEVVVKDGARGCLVSKGGKSIHVPALPGIDPVDTTAAGDSFNAAYLAARILGRTAAEAAQEGHRLAGHVIRHKGAIIARSAMPTPSDIVPGASS